MEKHVVILGAGEVGYHLAKTLVAKNRPVAIIDADPTRRGRLEEELDVSFFVGSGTDIAVLERAGIRQAELFIAAADNEEVNLVASALAKHLGASRCVVRLEDPHDLSVYRSQYEALFGADLLLSPQYLATIEIINIALGHNTHEIDFLAHGRIQLRTITIQANCPLTRVALRDIKMPDGARIVGYLDSDHDLSIPDPDQKPIAGGRAIIVCSEDQVDEVEALCSVSRTKPKFVVVAGGGLMGSAAAHALLRHARHVMVIERSRSLAERVASEMPTADVVCGDATDASFLRGQRIAGADSFISALGNDETNLMAALVAQELGARQVVATVRRTETSRLWEKAGTFHTVSPRFLAAQRITAYIENGYKPNLTSMAGGALRILQRRIFSASPVLDVSLADIGAPSGLIVGVIERDDRVWVPKPTDRLRTGDEVVLFVHERELGTVQLLFPGGDPTS